MSSSVLQDERQLSELQSAVGMRPRRVRDQGTLQLLDAMSEMQDEVLARQLAWLDTQDFSTDVKERLYKQFCLATGQMIHQLVSRAAA
jgi:hypothetical protein